MHKIEQGEFEIKTTKKDAIDKFMQLDEDCRDESSGGYYLHCYCCKDGKIFISSGGNHRTINEISTRLEGRIIERDGKTYVEYFTEFSKSSNLSKIIALSIKLLLLLVAAIMVIVQGDKIYILLSVLLVLGYISSLWQSVKEKKTFEGDSKIMVQELKNRVDAINMWDK